MKKVLSLLFIITFLLVGCGKETNNEVAGTITVVTSYTDAEERFKDVEEGFKELYPNVEDIKWESTGGDYDDYITKRMTTGDYGDVLLIPFSMTNKPETLEQFMEPIGSYKDVSKEYDFADQAMYKENTYALPISVNTLGMLYNEDVFKESGVKNIPSSSEEMYEACNKIKNNGKLCWYSNLNSLPMLWSGAITSYGGEQYMSDILEKGTIAQEGQAYREIFDFVYTMITKGYTEEDPLTGDYMKSEQLVADGDAAFMIMGSQSLGSVKQKSSNPESIKMAPFPVSFKGKQSMPIGPDELIGVSNKSENKTTAMAFLKYLISSESGYAYSNYGFSPEKDGNKDAPKDIAYQIEDYDTIRTIADEDPSIVTEFYNVANKANLSSMSAPLTELVTVATNDKDYQKFLEKIEKDWKQALEDSK